MRETESHDRVDQRQERLLTVDEVAKRLRIHRATVREYLNRGLLKGTSLGRRAGYRIKESDLEDFLGGNRQVESSRAPSKLPGGESGKEANLPIERRELLYRLVDILTDPGIPEETKSAFTKGIDAHISALQAMKVGINSPPDPGLLFEREARQLEAQDDINSLRRAINLWEQIAAIYSILGMADARRRCLSAASVISSEHPELEGESVETDVVLRGESSIQSLENNRQEQTFPSIVQH